MVNDELDYKVNGDDEDKEQTPQPGKEVDSQENAGNQTIEKRLFNLCPVAVLEVGEGQLSLSCRFGSQNQEEDDYGGKQDLGDVVVSEAEY